MEIAPRLSGRLRDFESIYFWQGEQKIFHNCVDELWGGGGQRFSNKLWDSTLAKTVEFEEGGE